MPNINKVVYGNTTLIDLTDTTAEAADVAQGKYFYGKDGVKTAGTGSGSGSDFVVSLSKNNQTGYWEPDKTWSEVSAAIADNKTFVFCIAGMTYNSELAADGAVYNDGVTVYLSYVVYETLQDQSNNYYTNEYWYRFDSTGVTEDDVYIYYDTAYADAQASDILSGKTAFNSSGSVSGSIPSKSSSDLTANNLTVTAPSGYYASAASKTLTDANLVAGNIKKDVSIFGVTGTYAGGSSSVDRGTFTPSSNTLSASLTVTRTVVGVMIIAETNPYQAGSGVRCLSGCLYDSSGSVAKINLGSNNAGTSGSVSYGTSNLTVSQSGTTLTVSSKNAANSGYFISGITYRWIAW